MEWNKPPNFGDLQPSLSDLLGSMDDEVMAIPALGLFPSFGRLPFELQSMVCEFSLLQWEFGNPVVAIRVWKGPPLDTFKIKVPRLPLVFHTSRALRAYARSSGKIRGTLHGFLFPKIWYSTTLVPRAWQPAHVGIYPGFLDYATQISSTETGDPRLLYYNPCSQIFQIEIIPEVLAMRLVSVPFILSLSGLEYLAAKLQRLHLFHVHLRHWRTFALLSRQLAQFPNLNQVSVSQAPYNEVQKWDMPDCFRPTLYHLRPAFEIEGMLEHFEKTQAWLNAQATFTPQRDTWIRSFRTVFKPPHNHALQSLVRRIGPEATLVSDKEVEIYPTKGWETVIPVATSNIEWWSDKGKSFRYNVTKDDWGRQMLTIPWLRPAWKKQVRKQGLRVLEAKVQVVPDSNPLLRR